MYNELKSILINEDLSPSAKCLAIACLVEGFTSMDDVLPSKMQKYGMSSSTITKMKKILPWDEICKLQKAEEKVTS